MDAKRLLSCTLVFAALCLGACRSNTESRFPAMTPQDSLTSHHLDLSSADCNALANEYFLAVQEARACILANWPRQCTLLVEQSLPCGCFTYVNLRNWEAVTKLRTVRNAWDAGGCSQGTRNCPLLVCSVQRPNAGECA